ncbi:hypothetical protein [Mesorhizobium sp.]|uniref:hypothetical protein n=1 Tax=Mesorhizobium sp. TaxID=1871066 RepID=UPI000FE7847A|nr:hypothetical protein [Mesorhizobium sp.]RWM10436.1 MAG: hypothetical protein EOR71_06670 [Mesorhizobium sp.]
MSAYFRTGVLAAIALMGLVEQSCAQTSLIPGSRDPYGLSEPPPVTRRAETASKAADLAQAAATWINELGVRQVVRNSIRSEDANIKALINRSGQAGVLFEVYVERTDGEIPFYSVVGDGIQMVGAGSSPIAINSAANQQDRLRPSPRSGAVVDTEKSYFLWFTKDANGIQATTYAAIPIIYETNRRYADKKLLETLNQREQDVAIEAAVSHIEKSVRTKKLKEKLADLKKRQDETNAAILRIDQSLKAELEKARKAQQASSTLSLLASALTLSSQIATLQSSLGTDAPASVGAAKSTAELKQIVDGMASESIKNGDKLTLQYGETIDRRRGVRLEYIQFLREQRYPIPAVPELRQLP